MSSSEPITAILAGGNASCRAKRVRIDLVARRVHAEQHFRERRGSGSAPLSPEDREELLRLARGVVPELQGQVQEDFLYDPYDEFVEVHRGDQVVRVESRRGGLFVSSAQEILRIVYRLLEGVAPLPPGRAE